MLGNQPSVAETWSSTIVSFETPHKLRDLCITQRDPSAEQQSSVEQQKFKIRLASSEERTKAASMLIQKMYSWRGYESGDLKVTPNRITLLSFSDDQMVVGTCTLGLDSPAGLSSDEIYKDKIDELRATGCRVCELIKLAVDQNVKSKRVLASLFHIAFIYARPIHGFTDVVIEVNPRHVLFYEKMLGFRQFGEERMCSRVSAPAVLLRLEIDYMERQILKFGGKMEGAGKERSLYPYFFSKAEEQGITNRLLQG